VYDYPLCNVATVKGIGQKGMSQFLKQPVTLIAHFLLLHSAKHAQPP